MTAPIRAFFNLLMESQRWPPERLRAWQIRQLTALAHHTRRTSPFYSFRLDKAFDPDGSVSLERWRDVPVITRGDLAKHRDAMISRHPIMEHGPFVDVSTSGSTGEPISVRNTRWLSDMSAASGWRSYRWHGVDCSKTAVRRFHMDGSKFEDGDNMGPWGPPWLPHAKRGRLIYSSYRRSPEEFWDIIARSGAAYVSCYVGVIEILAGVAARGSGLKLSGFLTCGEEVTDSARRIAAEAFGAKVLGLYSSTEAGAIAHPCPSGAGFHVCAESVYLEIVREDGTHAGPGEPGRVVVTPFGSTALPLIRYELGDQAVMGERCACGIGLPLLLSIDGRTCDLFRHPDGRRQVGARIENLRPLVGPYQWQVAQTGPTQFEVRYQAEDIQPAQPAKFTEEFRKLIFEDAQIEFKQVPGFGVPGRKKRMEYVNEWSGPQRLLG
jgi:phenylacetate-CoA ligase